MAQKRRPKPIKSPAEQAPQPDPDFQAVVMTQPPKLQDPAEFAQDLRQTRENRLAIYKVSLVRDGSLPVDRTQVITPQAMADLMRAYLGDVDREHFVVVLLDQQLKPIGINTVSVGNLTSALVHPREVFKPAILANAASIIVGHNHPSGDVQPSGEDKELTLKLKGAGVLLGIPLVDHVIVGDGTGQMLSLREQGLV
jgi:DNA repair protein RadC